VVRNANDPRNKSLEELQNELQDKMEDLMDEYHDAFMREER
jgi:hypothetical protein